MTMRSWKFDPNKQYTNTESFTLPPVGDQVAIVRDITDPKRTKTGDKFGCMFMFESCKNGGRIGMWVQCDENGDFLDSWNSRGKFQHLCHAIGLAEGQYYLDAFLGRCLMIEVEEVNGRLNIKRMWECTEDEREIAVDYLSRN